MADDLAALITGHCPERQNVKSATESTWASSFLKRNVKVVLLTVVLTVIVLLLVATVGLLGYNAFNTNRLSNGKQRPDIEMSNKHESEDNFGFAEEDEQDYEVGVRSDDVSGDCNSYYTLQAQYFPDMDYATLGYNIMKGYPLADGHDPGFTFPIFHANYSQNQHTADCRYMVPQGLVVIPDISCAISFASTVIKTEKELSSSLSISAGIDGEGWGYKFSASGGYQKTSSEITKGESIYIISKADCNYYFSKISEQNPPPFDPMFLQWVYQLNNISEKDKDTVFAFLDTYGTHFFLDVTFGAKYIYQHKMKSSDFESFAESGYNIEASANYAGLFTLGVNFKMNSKSKSEAKNFLEKVESKTITVGAAPTPDGDAQKWASVVHDNPVPVRYTLSSIENLFTEKYMRSLNVNYEKIFAKIKNASQIKYCQHLQDIGLVEICQEQESTDLVFFYMTNILTEASYATVVGNRGECIKICSESRGLSCHVALWAPSLVEQNQNCFLYKDTEFTIGTSSQIDLIVVRPNIGSPLVFKETTLKGTSYTFTGVGFDNCIDTCEYPSINIECVAFTYCDCSGLNICRVFTYDGIQGFEADKESVTAIIRNGYNLKSKRHY